MIASLGAMQATSYAAKFVTNNYSDVQFG